MCCASFSSFSAAIHTWLCDVAAAFCPAAYTPSTPTRFALLACMRSALSG
jgi:hypothetical protein